MEKQSLNHFVSKYNLAGLVESVKWESKDGSLTTSFISDDKSVLGNVTMKEFDGTDASFGVYDTTRLNKMLSVLGNDVDFSINDIDGKPVSLKFKDGSTSVNYMLADLSVIPNVPDLKQLPPFDVEIKLDSNFISKFIKARGALDENNFTFYACEIFPWEIKGLPNRPRPEMIRDIDLKIRSERNPEVMRIKKCSYEKLLNNKQ